MNTYSVPLLQILVDAVSEPFPPFFSKSFQSVFIYTKVFNIKHLKAYEANASSEALYMVNKPTDAQEKSLGGNLFLCQEGIHISSYYVCDEISDCPQENPSDETDCKCSMDVRNSSQCKRLEDSSGNTSICSPLFFLSRQKVCEKFTMFESFDSKSTALSAQSARTFPCKNGSAINNLLVNDFFADCGEEAEDEMVLLFVVRNDSHFPCSLPEQLPCRHGHPKCYFISEICIYRLNVLEKLIPCRTGEHLQNCSKFECNSMFKCPLYYCIPWSYLCDSKWDCPGGTDEGAQANCGQWKKCTNMFQCKYSHRDNQLCTHVSEVCDGIINCPHGDDEFFCSLDNVCCPRGCQCVIFALSCFNMSGSKPTAQFFYSSYHSINIENSGDTFAKLLRVFLDMNTVQLILKHNQIGDVCQTLPVLNKLVVLNIEHNVISTLLAACFTCCQEVRTIKLNNNCLSLILGEAFKNLRKLHFVSLANNKLAHIKSCMMVNTPRLSVMDLSGNNWSEISQAAFMDLTFQFLIADNFRTCCVLPHQIQCNSHPAWFESCQDMLPTLPVKLSCFFSSILLVLFSGLSSANEKKNAHGITVGFLNLVADFYAIYLFILSVADLSFQGNFPNRELQWKSGIVCHIDSGLALLYHALLSASICILSYSRLEVVLHPVDSKLKTTEFVLKLVLKVFFSSVVFVVGQTSFMWFLYDNIPFSLCSPFVERGKNIFPIKITTWLTLFLQSCSLVFNIVVYVILITELKQAQTAVQQARSAKRSNTSVITQVVILNLSLVLCWVPRNIILLMTQFLREYPLTMVIWEIIAISCLNSFIFPVVFLLRRATKN